MSKKKKILIIISVIAAAVLAVLSYLNHYFTNKFSTEFYPNTTVNNMDISYLTLSDAEKALAAETKEFKLTFDTEKSKSETIEGSDFSYEFSGQKELEDILKNQNNWLEGVYGTHDYELKDCISYDEEALKNEIKELSIFQDMQQPKDAYVDYQDKKFVVVPEETGSLYDADAFADDVCSNLSKTEYSADDIRKYQILPTTTSNDEALIKEADQKNSLCGFNITYDLPDGSNVTVTPEDIIDLMVKNENGDYVLESDGLSAFVDKYVTDLSSKIKTKGTKWDFTTHDGNTIQLENDAFGWDISEDEEKAQLLSEINNNTVTEREPIYSSRGLDGANGLGSSYIELDLSKQHMWCYQDGQVWLETDIVSGKMTHDRYTPEGIYAVYNKERNRHLRGEQRPDLSYEYDVLVDYWIPFNQAIGIHDAYWQSSYGGTNFIRGGSRGCINTPYNAVSQIYEWVKVGTPVVCYYSGDLNSLFID